MTASKQSAAAALADLFFLPGPSLSDAEKLRANELRQRYRDWRTNGSSGVPSTPDVLDLNHQAVTNERRSMSKMRRVKTVGARLDHPDTVSPVRVPPPARARDPGGRLAGHSHALAPGILLFRPGRAPRTGRASGLLGGSGADNTRVCIAHLPAIAKCSPTASDSRRAPCTSQEPTSDREGGPAEPAASSWAVRDSAAAAQPAPEAAALPPMVEGGGCPFRQDVASPLPPPGPSSEPGGSSPASTAAPTSHGAMQQGVLGQAGSASLAGPLS